MNEHKGVETTTANYEWLATQNLTSYQGNWIAVVDKKIVAIGKNAKELIQKVRNNYPNKTPFLALVPSREIMVV